jgi:hypothetical protein
MLNVADMLNIAGDTGTPSANKLAPRIAAWSSHITRTQSGDRRWLTVRADISVAPEDPVLSDALHVAATYVAATYVAATYSEQLKLNHARTLFAIHSRQPFKSSYAYGVRRPFCHSDAYA